MDNSEPQTDESHEQTGIALIASERRRQVSEEGWSAEHDSGSGHTDGGLAVAGACYAAGREATHVRQQLNSSRGMESAGYSYDYSEPEAGQLTWPWDAEWYKPTGNRVRDLVKAGALIAAEIDRLLRRAPPPQSTSNNSPKAEED